jgi:hypothetical protein
LKIKIQNKICAKASNFEVLSQFFGNKGKTNNITIPQTKAINPKILSGILLKIA